MIRPVNGHLLIEPLKHDSFISSDKGTYQEIGTIIDIADDLFGTIPNYVEIGRDVYFDSWLAGKYENPDDVGKFYWLVAWKDIKAVKRKNV